MPRETLLFRRSARVGFRACAAVGLALALGAAAGCSSSPSSTCYDVSGYICEKLAACGSQTPTFDSPEQCVASFNGFFEVGNSDDAACREEWALSEGLDCVGFENRYGI